MIIGMSTLGIVHTALSVLALMSGLIVVSGLLAAKRTDRWTAFYFASALATSATGFGFPGGFGVPQALGIVALVLLAAAILARYAFRLAGIWRAIYAAAAVLSVHTLVFFTIGEAFLRIPALKALAPNLTEWPFAVVQAVGLALFIALAAMAAKRFHPEASVTA
jgi:hypothetical protein